MARRVALLASPEVWARGHGPAHPLKPERLERTYRLLEEVGALEAPNVTVIPPRQATKEELTLFHTREYVRAVRALSEGDPTVPARRFNFGPGDNPVFSGMYDSEGLKVGSALQAARMLHAGELDVAFSYSGGLHHGGPDFASGFCVFNDAAVAIHWLLGHGRRVAYVDVDVHHGDGVQNAFYEDPRALTISIHQDGRTLFPGTGFIGETGAGPGEGFNLNLPLPPRTGDETYLWAFRQVVPPMVERFQPDVLVTQMGVDTHFEDPLASLALTTNGHAQIFAALEELSPIWLALGGGGYNLDVVPRSWSLAFGRMADLDLPEELPPNYRARYGGQAFHDGGAPEIPDAVQSAIRESVETTVARLRSIHGLN